MICARGLVRIYAGRPVVRRADLVARPGEITAIVGPSGAGKSTLLRLLAGLELADEGEIVADGRTLTAERLFEHRRHVTLVMQPPLLLRGSVRDNLAFPLRVRRVRGAERRRAVDEALAAVGLSELARARHHTLSAGEVARVALARALLARPRVLLLDEPTGNLDPANVERMEGLIRQYLERDGLTVLLVTHNLAQARRLSHTVAVMLEGRIVEQGTSGQMFSRPSTTEALAYFRTELPLAEPGLRAAEAWSG